MSTPLTQEYFDSKLDKLSTTEQLEDLAASVARGFDDVQQEFTRVHRRIDDLSDNLTAEIRSLRVEIDHHFAEVNDRIEALHSSVGTLGEVHRKVEQELTTLRSAYQDLRQRVDRMEQQMRLKSV